MPPKYSVLYVDDEPALLEVGKLFLEEIGQFSVDVTTSAPDALTLLNSKMYDAIISDYQMPEMDGIEFLKQVRRSGNTIPFILFTGRGREEVVIQALNEGADFYLQKGGEQKSQFAELAHIVAVSLRRQRVEEALRDSEDRYRTLVENANEAILVVQNGRIGYANPKLVEIGKYTPEELAQKPFLEFVHPDDRTIVGEQYRRRLTEEILKDNYVFRIVSKEGNVLWMETNASLITWNRQPADLVFLSDITERKRAEDAVRASEEKIRGSEEFLRTVITDAKEGIIVYDRDLRITLWNRFMEEMTGMKVADVLEKKTAEVFPFLKDKEIDLLMQQALTGLTAESADFEFTIGSTGKKGWVKSIYSPNYDAHGTIIGVIGIVQDITERKQAENELRAANEQIAAAEEELHSQYDELKKNQQIIKESEEFNRSLVENLPDYVIVYGPDGNILYVNPTSVAALGYTAEELIGKPVLSYVAEDYRDMVIARLASRKTDSNVPAYEIAIVRKDGLRRSMIVQGTHIQYRNTTATLLVLTDITERSRAEEALKESEGKFRALVDQSLDGIVIVDFAGTILFANNSAQQFTESTRDQMGKVNVLDIIAPEFRINALNDFARVAAGNDGYLVNYKILNRENKDMWIECIGKKISFAGSAAVILSIRDITARKLAEDALRESEDRYRTLIENADEAIFVIQDGRIRYANPKLEEIGKYTVEELAQKPFLEFVHPDDRTMIGEYHKRRLNGEPLNNRYAFRIVSKEGSVLWMEINASLITWNGRPGILVLLSDITERKRTEEELRESEEKYRTLIDITLDGILILDLTGTILFGNRAAGRIIDAEFAVEMLGTRNVMEFLAPESLPDAIRDFGHVVQGGDAYLVKYKVISTTGREVWIESMGKKITFEGLPAILLSLREVTERHRTDEALRESEEKFRTLVENSLDGILILDLTGTILFGNRAAGRIIDAEFAVEMFGTRNVMEFIAPESRSQVLHDFSEVAQGIDSYPVNYQVISSTGQQIWVEVIGRRIVFQNSPAILVSMREISSRKRMEEELRKSEKKYRDIINKMQDAIYRTDREGKLIMFSPHGVKLAGYDSEEQMIGLNVAFDTYQNPKEREQFLAILKEKGSVENYPLVLKTRYGIPLQVTASSHFYYDDEGNVLGVEGILHDITELRKKEQALHEANRKLNLLSGITRHDINNQLTVLQGYLAILEKKQPDPSLNKYFQKATTAAQRISTMIQFTGEYEKIGVNAPVWQNCRKLVDTATKQAPLGNVTMNNDLPAGAEVFADPLIVKVFYNMMDNAVRYGGKITTIRFSAQESSDNHLILCEDDGNGIPADEKERIFEHEFGKNTGLGLFLAREILNITGITIRETGTPGKGARFEMTVPKGNWRITAKEI